ncbi:MAG: Ig-like domain-containing protein [Thermoflexales bacterium]|nr:Ig-like domain-containing protein [Thermoflexales bacterium]
MYIEGQTDRRADTLHMVLWSGDGRAGSRDGAVEIRVAGGKTQGRVGQADWQDMDDLSQTFAPGHDPLGFLAGAQDIVKESSQTRPLDPSGGSSVSFTRYSFALNGPAFAATMRDQLEAELIKKGELPPGIKLDTARVYAGMTGQGEIWIDSRGLPLRQVIRAEFPPYGKERIEIAITTDFSQWSQVSGSKSQVSDLVSRASNPYEAVTLVLGDERVSGVLFSVLVLAAVASLVILLISLPSRLVYAGVTLAVIASMLFSPLLQSQQVLAFSDRQAQAQAKSELERENAKAQQEAQDELNAKDWNPLADPLANQVSKSANLQSTSTLALASSSSASASSSLCDAIVSDDGTDSDIDGLSDIEEGCIGTDPNLADTDGDGLKDGTEVFDLGTNPLADGKDSDGDGINDGAEVRGFVDDQNRHWYLNPLDIDSNGDKIIDRLEVPLTEDGELACSSLNADGSARCANWQVDTDLDGTPDVFDFDDDGDGVPDQVDSARTLFVGGLDQYGQKSGLIGQSFSFELSNLRLNTPVFADFQVRPVNPEHLWYSLNVLDWPSGDTEGQIQRVHDTTFGTTGHDANGDMRLIPMLEIIIPYKEGHYGNLPVKPGAPAIAPGTPVDAWLDTEQTDMFNITVRTFNEAGDLAAYVPLALVKDPNGGNPVAFAARMVYWPSVEASGQAGVADGGEAQTARLMWAIQLKSDVCRPQPDDYNPLSFDARTGRWIIVDWCDDPNHWDETTTIAQSYYDDWYLTGFEVREDRGLKTAVIYEQPDYAISHGYNASSYYEAYLWALANDLDETFVAGRGRDTDGDGYGDARDLTLDDIWTRFHAGSTAGETERWGIPANALEVVVNSFPHQGYLPTLPMTVTPNILNTAFMDGSTPRVANPSLLFAREERFRLAGLGDNSQIVQYSASPNKGMLVIQELKVNMAPELVGENVLASLSWAPFAYDSGQQAWKSDPVDEYVVKLRARLAPHFAAGGDWNADAVEGAGLVATSFYLGLYTGVNRVVELDGVPLTFEYAKQDVDVSFKSASTGGAVAKFVVNEILEHVATDFGHSWWWNLGRKLLETSMFKKVFGANIANNQLTYLEALGKNNGKGYGGAMASLKNIWKYGLFNGKISPKGVLVGAVIIGAIIGLAVVAYATFKILSKLGVHVPGEEIICTAIMSSIMVGVQGALLVLSLLAFKDLTNVVGSWGSRIANVFKAFSGVAKLAVAVAVVAMVITVAVTMGMFLASVIAGHIMPGSMAFDQLLAAAMASIIVAAIMLAISFIPIFGPIIVAIIGLIDTLIIAVCNIVEAAAQPNPNGLGWGIVKNYVCGGISGLLTTGVQTLIYDLNPLIDMEAPDRMTPTNFDIKLVDPALGFSVGNKLTVKADVITTLYRNSPFEPDKMKREIEELIEHKKFSTLQGLIDDFGPGILYIWQFADPFLNNATFRYKLTASRGNKAEVDIKDMEDEWDKVAKKLSDSRRFKTTQRVGETGNIHFTQAGLNWHPPLYLVESFAFQYQECVDAHYFSFWTFGIPLTACWLRPKEDSLAISLGNKFKFDVFPATLDEFYRLAGKGQASYALAWDERFPTLCDADGDGLRSQACSGSDPDDADADTDGDGLPDYYELQHALPVLANDADSDGLNDYDELRYGTSVRLSDSDGDGLSDKEEVDGWNFVYAFDAYDQPLVTHVTSDPSDPDTDGDGLSDKLEQVYHFNPRVYSLANVLELSSDIDDADGIVAPGQPIVYTATVENKLRDIYALGLLELEFPASQNAHPEPLVYSLAPRQAMTVTQQTVVNPSISASGPVSLTQRAGAEMTDLRGEAGGRVLWLKLDSISPSSVFTDSSLNGNDGTCSGAACPSAGQAGYIGKATRFYSSDNDYISIPRPVADDFSIAFWFKSSQVAGSDDQWWQGMGLVDGEVAGLANDFGVSLGAGRVLFGVGNPDVTIRSENVADGEWHHVAATRDKESGRIRLYVDGLSVASDYYDNSTASLASPPSLRIGSLQTGNNFFDGLIDDVQVYPTTLDANQVMELYNQPVFKLSMDKLECTTYSGGLTYCGTPDEAGEAYIYAICFSSAFGSTCPQSAPGVRKNSLAMPVDPLYVIDAARLSSGDFSQSVWIKPTDSTTTARQGVWGYSPEWDSSDANYRGDPSRYAYPSIFIAGTRGLEVGFGNGGIWQGCVLTDVLTLNQWNHVVATYDYNPATLGGTYNVYVNSQLKGTCGRNGKPTSTSEFELGRATRCAQVENPKVYCIKEPGDSGDHAEFYASFDGGGYAHRWWGLIEGVDTGETFNTGAEPHDYCGSTTLKVEEADDDTGDDTMGTYTFDHDQPSRTFTKDLDEPDGEGELRLYLTHTNPSVPYEGPMDELALYRRTLSADEVLSLYLAAERAFEIDLDETPGRSEFADATANGYTAVCTPPACPDSGLPGRFNQAARFDGVDDSLSLNTPGGIEQFTVAAWVRRMPGGNTTYKPIISYGGYSCGFGLGLNADGSPQAQIKTASAWGAAVDSNPVPDYTWVHLAASYDGYTLRLYRDGAFAGSTVAPGAELACTGSTTIGSKRETVHNDYSYFTGYLDQVVLFGQALSDVQVRALSQEAPVTSLHLDEPLYEPLSTTPTSRFDNAAQSGDTYDATCTACPAAGQKGWMRQAPVFDGAQSLSKTDDNIIAQGGFSVGGWFKLSKALTTTNQVLAGKDSSFSLYVPGSAETVTRTLVYFGVQGLAPSQVLKPSLDYPGLLLNQWTYIFATYSSDSDVATLYVNGHKVGVGNVGPTTYGASELTIGQNMVGQADEVTVYNYPLHPRDLEHIYEYQVHWYDTAVSHDLIVDADDPVISLELAPYITGRDIVVAAIANDPTSPVTAVAYRLDGGDWQRPTQDQSAWAWTLFPGGEGWHTLELTATDSVGHIGWLTKTYAVDITGPEIHLDAALTGAGVVIDNSQPLSLYGTVTDSGCGVDKVFVTLIDGLGQAASSPQLASLSGSTWQVVYTDTTSLNGLYTVQMDATDRLGNLSTNALRRMTAFGARAASTSALNTREAVMAQAPVQLDSSPPLANVYDVTPDGGWALSGTLESGLPVISGTASSLAYPTGQIIAFHMEEPAAAAHFQDTGPGHALGTCTAGACPQAGLAGRFGQAISFDGGDGINLGANRRLGELAGLGSFSLLAWVNPTDTAGTQHLLGFTPVISPNTGFDWRLEDGAPRLQIFGDKTYTTTGNLTTGWTHVAAVMATLAEGGSALTFYVNGVPAQTITSTLTGQANTGDDWLIGQGFKGLLDELVVYDRPLSTDQILALARPAPTGLDRLEVGLFHLKDWGDEDAIQWQPATLNHPGQSFSTWSYTVPAQTEGTHRLYLRATDRLNHSLSLPNVWQGEVDTATPQAVLTHIAPRFPGDLEFYRCQAWDYNLVETGYTCPVSGSTFAYHAEPWFTAVFSYPFPYTVTSPLVGLVQTDPGDELTACDGMGQCTTVTRTTLSLAWPLGVAILTPTTSLVISATNTPLSVAGAAYAQNNLQDLYLSLGSQAIYTQTSWGDLQQSAWSTVYTPTREGAYPLLASLSDQDGTVITSAAPIDGWPGPLSLVYVDFTPPDVSLSTQRINSANFDNGFIRVSGLVSEATQLASLQVRLDDGASSVDDVWQDAVYSGTYPLLSQPWTANLYSTLTAPPEGRSYTLTVRAIDIAGRQAEIVRVVPADAVPPAPPITVTLSYSAGLVITPGMTIVDIVSPELSLTWTSSASPDLDRYTVEWLNDPQQLAPSHVQQSVTLPTTAHQASFTGPQQSKLWARLSSLDAFDNTAVKQFGPVYIDDELTPVYVDMGEGEAAGSPYQGWLQAGCNQLGQDSRPAGRSLPSGPGQPQAFYAAWNREGLRMTWSGADWRSDGNLFIYLDSVEGGQTKAYNPFSQYGDDVYLPTYRVQTTTYRMAADYVVWVQYNASSPFSTSVQLLNYDGSWDIVPTPGIEYAFDAGQSPALTDLYVPFASLGITNPVSQSLGLAAFATEPDSLRLWAAAPSGNKLNSRWITGQYPSTQPLGLSQRYYWPSVGDGVCPRDGERSGGSQVQVSLDTRGLAIGYSLLGHGLPISVSDHLASLIGWDQMQSLSCMATPNAAGCTPQIDTSTPVTVDVRAKLARFNTVTPQPLGQGRPVSLTVRLSNQGKTQAVGVRLLAQSWGHLRMTGITQTAPVTIPAGGQVVQTLEAVVDLGHDAAHDDGWAKIDVAVLDKDSVPLLNGYIYPVDWLYAEYEIDQAGPDYMAIQNPPSVLLKEGPSVLQGSVRDQSPVPTITVDLRRQISGVMTVTSFTCVDTTPADRQWTCPIDTGPIDSAPTVTVGLRVKGADVYGQASTWFRDGQPVSDGLWQDFQVDSEPPVVSLSSATLAALGDGVIGPSETTWDGQITDTIRIEAVEVCDPAPGGDCELIGNLVPADKSLDKTFQYDLTSLRSGAPQCDSQYSRNLYITHTAAIRDLNVGLAFTATSRSTLRVYLQAPSGLQVLLIGPGSSALTQNYNVTLDDAATVPLWQDADDHVAGAPYYQNLRIPSNLLSAFNLLSNANVMGEWRVSWCDTERTRTEQEVRFLSARFSINSVATVLYTEGNWRYSLPVQSLDGVSQTRRLVGIDNVGYRSQPLTLTYKLDTVAPALTVTHALTDVDRLYLSGSVSDGGELRLLRVRMTLPNGGQYATVISNTATGWLYNAVPSPYQAGNYTVWIEAEDWVGNIAYAGPFNLSLPALPNRVEQVNPANGATNVALNQPVVIDFSQAMRPESLNLAISPTLVLTPTWNAEKTRVNLGHPYFLSNTAYHLEVVSAINQGSLLLDNVPYTWTFTTGTTIADEADLGVSLARVGSGDVTAGDLISYTATVTNNGPASITSALLTFNFGPADSVAWAGGPGCTWAAGTEVMTCTVSLSGFTPVSLTMSVRAVGSFDGVLRNTVTVAPPAAIIDPNALNDTAGPVTVAVNKRHYIYLPVVLKGI